MVLPLSILEDGDGTVPNTVRRAERRTSDAVATFYPGIEIPVSEQVFRDAIEITEAVVQGVEEGT